LSPTDGFATAPPTSPSASLETRFDGDQSRNPSIPASSHESAIDSVVDYLDIVVPTGDEFKDGETLERVRDYIRTSGGFPRGLLVGQGAGLGVDDDHTAFYLTVDVDTPI
jgi:hypothetical protein